jgi:hypothetical protein
MILGLFHGNRETQHNDGDQADRESSRTGGSEEDSWGDGHYGDMRGNGWQPLLNNYISYGQGEPVTVAVILLHHALKNSPPSA